MFLDPESCWEGAKVSSLPFSNWLNENINEERKTTNIQWDSRTVFLDENKPDYRMRI